MLIMCLTWIVVLQPHLVGEAANCYTGWTVLLYLTLPYEACWGHTGCMTLLTMLCTALHVGWCVQIFPKYKMMRSAMEQHQLSSLPASSWRWRRNLLINMNLRLLSCVTDSMWISQSCGTSGQVSWHTHVSSIILPKIALSCLSIDMMNFLHWNWQQ